MIGVPVVILIIVLVIIVKNSKKLKDAKSQTYLINFMSDYTDGYGIGKVLEEKHNKYKSKYLMFPYDIDYSRVKEKDFVVENQDIFVKKALDVSIPVSRRAKIKLLFPHKSHLLSQDIRSSLFGTYIAQFIEDVNSVSDETELNDLRNKRLAMLKERTSSGGLGLVTDVMSESREAMNILAKKSLDYPEYPREERKKDEK
jgi:hypothetical protein